MASAITGHISALEQAQAELAEAHEQFRAAFEQAPVAMALVAADARYFDVNPALCKLLGRTRETLLASSVQDVTHPDDLESTRSAIRAALEGRVEVFEMEKQHLHADGHAVPTLTKVSCVRGPSGELAYFIAHMVDLSQLREAEQRFRRIVDSSPDVFVVVDSAGVVEVARGRLIQMFGLSAAEVVGRPIEVLLPEWPQVERHARQRPDAGEEVREMADMQALRGRRADGSEFPVEMALGPILIDGERRLLVTVRDVTQRRQGEAATRELSDMRTRQRQAIEINDNIVQGLTIARWSFDLGEVEAARSAVERTVVTARLLVDRMLSLSGAVEPGALRRDQPMDDHR